MSAHAFDPRSLGLRTVKLVDQAAGAGSSYDLTVQYDPDFVYGEFFLPINTAANTFYVQPNGAGTNTHNLGYEVYDGAAAVGFQTNGSGFVVCAPGEAGRDHVAGRFWLDAKTGFKRRFFGEGAAYDVDVAEVIRANYCRGLWNDSGTALATVRITGNVAACFTGSGWIRLWAGWWG